MGELQAFNPKKWVVRSYPQCSYILHMTAATYYGTTTHPKETLPHGTVHIKHSLGPECVSVDMSQYNGAILSLSLRNFLWSLIPVHNHPPPPPSVPFKTKSPQNRIYSHIVGEHSCTGSQPQHCCSMCMQLLYCKYVGTVFWSWKTIKEATTSQKARTCHLTSAFRTSWKGQHLNFGHCWMSTLMQHVQIHIRISHTHKTTPTLIC
jgi:hypothetical protein